MKIDILSVEGKRTVAKMTPDARHDFTLQGITQTKNDPVGVMLIQAAVLQENEEVLWAMAAYGRNHISSKAGLENFDSIAGNLLAPRKSAFTDVWIERGRQLREMVLIEGRAE